MRKGFTLLEVLIGVTIFVVAASALIFVSSRNIGRLETARDRVDGLYVVKSEIYGVPCEKNTDVAVDRKKRKLEYGIVETIFDVRKRGRTLFTFRYYEKE
ncbi:prepilin-type N-terminal cleavage/methylation domain-containing protein [Desulfurobacterium sp.]